METLTLKLLITPVLIGTASLAGRRWGPAVSGLLVGFPLTSGPIIVFLALERGTAFAQATAIGMVGSACSQAAFALAFAIVARRAAWPFGLTAATLAFLATTALLAPMALTLVPVTVAAVAATSAALRLLPEGLGTDVMAPRPLPHWDLPGRMIVATAFVIVLTTVSSALGPRLTGLLSSFPVYAAVLTSFAQHQQGVAAALRFLRGLLLGVYGYVAFFIVVATLVTRVPLTETVLMAGAVNVLMQFASLGLMHGHKQTV